MASKDKNPNPDKDPAKPEPAKPAAASKDNEPTAKEPEVIAPKTTPSPALAPSSKSKKGGTSSGLLGVLAFLLLIIAGGAGAGGYYLYQEQKKFKNETLAKLSQLEGQLNALDTDADQTRRNKQSIETLGLELQQFRTEIDATLKSHQNALSTLDEDVMRLKEKMEPPAEPAPAESNSLILDGIVAQPKTAPDEQASGDPEKQALEDVPVEPEDPEQESQKFVQWMENFFAAIWNWLVGLFR